jgi:hypothetical protein
MEARLVEGLIAQARREPDRAEKALGETLAMAERLGARFFAARVRLCLAAVADTRGDHEGREAHRAFAHAEFQALDAPVWAARAAG